MISANIEMPYCLGYTGGKQQMYEAMFSEMVEEGCDLEEIRDAWTSLEKRSFERWGGKVTLAQTDKEIKAHDKWFGIHMDNIGRKVIV
jgi:hypothetical protein